MKQRPSNEDKNTSTKSKVYISGLIIFLGIGYLGFHFAENSKIDELKESRKLKTHLDLDKTKSNSLINESPTTEINRKTSDSKIHQQKFESIYKPKHVPMDFKISEFLDHLNEDGSIGEQEKTMCTSLVLMSFLSFGFIYESKEYGAEIKKMALYIAEKPFEDESTKEKVTALRALSNLYSMTKDNYILHAYKKRLLNHIEEVRNNDALDSDDQYYSSFILSHSKDIIPDDIWNKKDLADLNIQMPEEGLEKVHLRLPNFYNSNDKHIMEQSLDFIETVRIYRYLPEIKVLKYDTSYIRR